MFTASLIFLAFVGVLLAIDLGVFNKEDHEITVKEALRNTCIFVALALGFAGLVYVAYDKHWFDLGTQIDVIDGNINDGHLAAVKFVTGYLIELSLSADNVFLIALIFLHLRIPKKYQHRILFWGVLGAIGMRAVLIVLGAELVANYHWIFYVFGAFLIYTAIKMLFMGSHDDESPDEGKALKLIRWVFPTTNKSYGHDFFAKEDKWRLTQLGVALMFVELTDLVFALDSIPAIFAITADPFIVFTSNIFAILGLRSLYFALAGAMDRFVYLKISLAVILALVGAKMLAGEWLKSLGPHINQYMLLAVVGILATGVAASMWVTRKGPVDKNTH